MERLIGDGGYNFDCMCTYKETEIHTDFWPSLLKNIIETTILQ